MHSSGSNIMKEAVIEYDNKLFRLDYDETNLPSEIKDQKVVRSLRQICFGTEDDEVSEHTGLSETRIHENRIIFEWYGVSCF